MNLKKIDPNLQKALIEGGLTDANELQQEIFSTIKSGADCLVIAPEEAGKTTSIAISVIQRLSGAKEESPRALIMVETKEKVLEMEALFTKLGEYSDLDFYGVHERGDIDYDKNMISTGVDILIGTPDKLNEMFSTAGFNVNRLRMLVIDDLNQLLKSRHDSKIMRLSNSIAKTQRIAFAETFDQKVDQFAEKFFEEPFVFDFNEDE
ncbi:MAG: DEAD/DEAH box helicase [Flavobacterium sp.]|nr:MAG: DEAD/DEAH box helicase [Flavobacterium sp.]